MAKSKSLCHPFKNWQLRQNLTHTFPCPKKFHSTGTHPTHLQWKVHGRIVFELIYLTIINIFNILTKTPTQVWIQYKSTEMLCYNCVVFIVKSSLLLKNDPLRCCPSPAKSLHNSAGWEWDCWFDQFTCLGPLILIIYRYIVNNGV